MENMDEEIRKKRKELDRLEEELKKFVSEGCNYKEYDLRLCQNCKYQDKVGYPYTTMYDTNWHYECDKLKRAVSGHGVCDFYNGYCKKDVDDGIESQILRKRFIDFILNCNGDRICGGCPGYPPIFKHCRRDRKCSVYDVLLSLGYKDKEE